MNLRKQLVAVFACRNDGTRLYVKLLQNLDIKKGVAILNYLIKNSKYTPGIKIDSIINYLDKNIKLINLTKKFTEERYSTLHIWNSKKLIKN